MPFNWYHMFSFTWMCRHTIGFIWHYHSYFAVSVSLDYSFSNDFWTARSRDIGINIMHEWSNNLTSNIKNTNPWTGAFRSIGKRCDIFQWIWFDHHKCKEHDTILFELRWWRNMFSRGMVWVIDIIVWLTKFAASSGEGGSLHDDVIKWKQVPRYWPFVRGIHRQRWIPRTKTSDTELWCFLWSGPE